MALVQRLPPIATGAERGIDGADLRNLETMIVSAQDAVRREMARQARGVDGGSTDRLAEADLDLRVARDAVSAAAAQVDRYLWHSLRSVAG